MSVERDLLGRWHNGGLLPEEYMQLMKETKELLAQPEQTEQITFKDDADKIAHLENSVELLAGLLDAKKREPLSDEAVCQILLKKEWFGFVELVRQIEKAHGITGVDDE